MEKLKIERARFVITRKERTEIFCGLARNYTFKKISEIGDTSIKTYMSKKKAESAYLRSWYNAELSDIEVLEITESYLEI
jgi:hypothetical protein